MPSRGLNENIDADYSDDPVHPDIKQHQIDHGVLAAFANLFDTTPPANGNTIFFSSTTGLWYAANPATGATGPAGAQGRGLRWLGAWSGATAYKVYNGTTVFADDLVSFNGEVYIATANSTGSQPPSANWALFSQRGADGADGADGATGAQGIQGDPGPSEETLDKIPISGATRTLDVAAGTVKDVILSTDCVFTLAAPTTGASSMTVWFHQGAGGNTISFTNSITWGPAGSPPAFATGAGDVDVVTFDSIDGVWWGFPSLLGGSSPAGLLDVDILGTIVSTGSGTSFATPGTIDVDPDDLVVVGIVTLRSAGTPTTPVPTGMGITTWTEAFTTNIWNTGAQNKALSMFLGQQASPGSPAALTIGYGGVTQTGCLAIIARVKNVTSNAKTLADSKAVVANNVGTPATSISVALAAAANAANRALAFVVSNDLNGFNPRANWTELTDITLTTPVSISLQAQWRDDAFEATASGAKTSGGSGPLGIAATELEQG